MREELTLERFDRLLEHLAMRRRFRVLEIDSRPGQRQLDRAPARGLGMLLCRGPSPCGPFAQSFGLLIFDVLALETSCHVVSMLPVTSLHLADLDAAVRADAPRAER